MLALNRLFVIFTHHSNSMFLFFPFLPLASPVSSLPGGQQSELDVRVGGGPADKSQSCSECAGGSSRAEVKVTVARDFLKNAFQMPLRHGMLI